MMDMGQMKGMMKGHGMVMEQEETKSDKKDKE
jgi:hypothetical protein